YAVSPGLGASKNGAGNVTGSTAMPSARAGERETNAAADPRISLATSLLEPIIRLILSPNRCGDDLAGSHLKSTMYSDFPSATSTSVFEEVVFLYLTGTASFLLVPETATRCLPGMAPSPALKVDSSKVPSGWILPLASRPLSGSKRISPRVRGLPLYVTFPLTGTVLPAYGPALEPQPQQDASRT